MPCANNQAFSMAAEQNVGGTHTRTRFHQNLILVRIYCSLHEN